MKPTIEIEIVIDDQGGVTVEVKGVKGSGCTALTKALESAIGTTTGDVKKPEFTHAQGAANVQQH